MPGLDLPAKTLIKKPRLASERSPLLVSLASKAESRHFYISAFVVICVVLCIALLIFPRETGQGFYGQYGADRWVLSLLPNQAHGFFLDIGAYDGEKFSNSKLLEQNGWRGVCADPFPRNFHSRACKVVAQPVGPVGGAHERMADCSEGVSGFLHHMRGEDMLSGISRYAQVYKEKVSKCPEMDMQTIGVADLLALGNAPRVIDYVNLDTEGAELHILQGFPFDRHCVRTWTIEHNCEEPKQSKIKELLESKGCRVAQVMVDWWAICPCGDNQGDYRGVSGGKLAGHNSTFDLAFHSKNFFLKRKSERPWSGFISKCCHAETGHMGYCKAEDDE